MRVLPASAASGVIVEIYCTKRAVSPEGLDDARRGLVDGEVRCQDEVRIDGGLVRVVDPGEAGDLAGPSARVETLRIALLADLEWRVDEHLQESQPGVLVACAHA